MKRGKTPHPSQPTEIHASKPVTYRLIKEFRREALNPDNTANQIVLWVIQWSGQTQPVLEKRRLYVKKDGVTRTYQLMGLNLTDLRYMAERFSEICEALQQ